MQNPCCPHVSGDLTQYEISKQIYTMGIFRKYKLTPATKLVLQAITNHYNPRSKEAYPSQKHIAYNLGVSEKSVERAIKELSVMGLIMYETKYVNHYKFTAKFFAELEMSESEGQNVGNKHRQIVGQTNNHEQINNKEKIFNFSDEKRKYSNYDYGSRYNRGFSEKSNTISVERTRELLDKIEENKKKSISPLDFSKEEAINYVHSLPKELRNSFFATQLKEKYAFE